MFDTLPTSRDVGYNYFTVSDGLIPNGEKAANITLADVLMGTSPHGVRTLLSNWR